MVQGAMVVDASGDDSPAPKVETGSTLPHQSDNQHTANCKTPRHTVGPNYVNHMRQTLPSLLVAWDLAF